MLKDAKSKKVVVLPQPVDAEGKVLTAEEISEKLLVPTYIPVELSNNDFTGKFFVACDFDLVKQEFEDSKRSLALQLSGLYAQAGGADGKVAMSNLSSDQLKQLHDFQKQERTLDIEMVVTAHLDSNVPNMPKGDDELKLWLTDGGKTANEVLGAVVDAYDPTSAARRKEAEKLAESQMKPPSNASGESGASQNESPAVTNA